MQSKVRDEDERQKREEGGTPAGGPKIRTGLDWGRLD